MVRAAGAPDAQSGGKRARARRPANKRRAGPRAAVGGRGRAGAHSAARRLAICGARESRARGPADSNGSRRKRRRPPRTRTRTRTSGQEDRGTRGQAAGARRRSPWRRAGSRRARPNSTGPPVGRQMSSRLAHKGPLVRPVHRFRIQLWARLGPARASVQPGGRTQNQQTARPSARAHPAPGRPHYRRIRPRGSVFLLRKPDGRPHWHGARAPASKSAQIDSNSSEWPAGCSLAHARAPICALISGAQPAGAPSRGPQMGSRPLG